MNKFDKYKQNLTRIDDKIYSYATNVATVEYPNLVQHGWWSVTTQKHINYVAEELKLKIVKDYE